MLERLGYLGKAEKAARLSGRLQDADHIRVMIEHGGDIFAMPRTPAETLERLQSPDGLSNEFNAIFSCYNISPRSILQLSITEDTQTVPDLVVAWKETYEGTSLADFGYNTSKNYIGMLVRYGMVDERDGLYTITPRGVTRGQPIAAKILQFEMQEGYSVYTALGSIAQEPHGGTMSPALRAKIFLELMNEKRASNIAQSFNESELNTFHALDWLRNEGFVAYDFEQAPYRGQVVRFKRKREITEEDVIGIIHNNELLTHVVKAVNAIDADTLFYNKNIQAALPPEYMVKRKSNRSLTSDVSVVLNGLAGKGLLEKLPFNIVHQVMETATLTEKGKTFVRELLIPIVAALGDDQMLQEWRETVVPEMQTKLSSVARITGELYYPYSNSYRRGMKDRRKDEIVEYLTELQGLKLSDGLEAVFHARDLAGLLKLPKGTVDDYIEELIKEGRIVRRLRDNMAEYSVST